MAHKLFHYSVSSIAMSIALIAFHKAVQPASAEEIIYNAKHSNVLQQDLTGDTALATSHKSLFPQKDGSQSNNIITLQGDLNSANVVNGKDNWNISESVVAPYVVYGGVAVVSDVANNGVIAGSVAQNTVNLLNLSYSQSNDAAANGVSQEFYGGGVGGFGGAVIIGGVSIGGVGHVDGTNAVDAYGGAGGDVSGNTVNLVNVELTGAKGGAAGAGIDRSGGGIGGFGGASVFGGVSIGGAGGAGLGDEGPAFGDAGSTADASGGAAGDVSNNIVTLDNVILNGGTGGNGGSSTAGGSGIGGFGGGSVFGGVSLAGAAGYSVNAENPNGANGGSVRANIVTLSNTTLNGADGGQQDQVDSYLGSANVMMGMEGIEIVNFPDDYSTNIGANGIGGFGGGSVFGGLSFGGAGGYTYTSNGTYASIGGNGGDVSDNTVSLYNVTLNGGDGAAVKKSFLGGSGVSGFGGGSVFGGISIGGAAGYTFNYTIEDSTIDNRGGNGGAVTYNNVVLDKVISTGGISGATGLGHGGTGVAGLEGGGVYGGVSIGGAGGYTFKLNSSNYASSATGGNGGNGGEVAYNSVSLTDVTLNGSSVSGASVYGGLSIGGAGGYNNAFSGAGGSVHNNAIHISGTSLITGNIYGGYSQGGTAATAAISDYVVAGGANGLGGKTTDNTVTLQGDKITLAQYDTSGNITAYGSIYGGYSINGDKTLNTDFDTVMSGNTINLYGYRGTVNGIYNFENYNWILPTNIFNNDTLITIAGNDAVDLTNTKHTVALVNDGNRLYAGDKITLINKVGGELSSSTMEVSQGHFIIYNMTLAKEDQTTDTALVLTVDTKDDHTPLGGYLNPRSKSFSEGRAAALGFINQGTDLIATAGINDIRNMLSSKALSEKNLAIKPFMITSGSSQRYNTGSHIDINGFNMAVGFATGFETKSNQNITLGAFFEYGRATYDTYNSYTDYASVHGDGDTNYKGGGIFGRIDFMGTGLGKVNTSVNNQGDGLYVEASLRAGKASTDFDGGNTLIDAEGYRGSYTSKANYYAGHAAAGYVFNFDEKQSLNIYGRYLWSYMHNDTVQIGNDKLHFAHSNSSRMQFGGRYSYVVNDQFKPYIGAAYEYEAKGDIRASAYDLQIDKPSLKGSTGIFEAGFSLQPISSNKSLSLNFNGQAYIGQRSGGGGSVNLKYQF